MLTTKQIEELHHNGRDRLVADISGLFLRIRPSGKSWAFLYTHPTSGKQVRISFGTYPKVQPTTARQLARDAFQLIAVGKESALKYSFQQSGTASRRQKRRLY